jgi:hypothetical protein
MVFRMIVELTGEVKLTDFGGAVNGWGDGAKLSKEDLRAVELAERAQTGEYDDGETQNSSGWHEKFLTRCQSSYWNSWPATGFFSRMKG